MKMTYLWLEFELRMIWPLESDGISLGMVCHTECEHSRFIDEAITKPD